MLSAGVEKRKMDVIIARWRLYASTAMAVIALSSIVTAGLYQVFLVPRTEAIVIKMLNERAYPSGSGKTLEKEIESIGVQLKELKNTMDEIKTDVSYMKGRMERDG